MKLMYKSLYLYLILFCYTSIFGQNKEFDLERGFFGTDTTFTNNFVFDYFRQEKDSIIYTVGSVFLMPSDSISFKEKNEYIFKVSSPENGFLEIFFKNRLIYKYTLFNYRIHGTGCCYYPFDGNIAIQGQFMNAMLNGYVFVQRQNGEIIEVMKFKCGKYRKHIYHWLALSDKSLRNRNKKRGNNPLCNKEAIVI